MRTLIVNTGLAALLCTVAVAQGGERPIHIGFGGGVSVPIGDAKDALKRGYNAQGVVSAKLPGMPLGVRGIFNFQKFEFESSLPSTQGDATAMSGLGNATFALSAGPIRPYITAGVGAFSTKSKLDAPGSTSSDSKVEFGINGGAGIEFKLMSLVGYVEARMDNIYTDKGFNSALTDKSSTQLVPVTFGIMF